MGTELPAQDYFSHGSVPNPKGNRICTPTGEVGATELCPTPGEEHSQFLLSLKWRTIDITALRRL